MSWTYAALQGRANGLGARECQLVATFTSALNACTFCHQGHLVEAEKLGVAAGLVEALVVDIDTSPIDDKLKVLMRFVKKLNDIPSRVSEVDMAMVLDAGWSENQFFDAVNLCGLFNYFNRLADAYGLELPEGFGKTAAAAAEPVSDLDRRQLLAGAAGAAVLVACATPVAKRGIAEDMVSTSKTDSAISAAYPFESKYVEVLGSKMHYIEEGEGDPILYVHGQPTWSYLWRNVLPHTVPHGRSIAVDLIGFGKSDKPDIEYRFHDHVRYLEGFIAALGLKKIVFVVHDWGSALAFHYSRRNESKVRGIAFMEAILGPFATWDDFPAGARPIFEKFRSPTEGWDLLVNQNAFIENMLPSSVMRKLSSEEMDQYRAPFLDVETRKPLWRWPNELPIGGEPADVAKPLAAYHQWLQQTALPKMLCAVSPGALIDERKQQWCVEHMKNLELVRLGQGIHFVQEDHPRAIGQAVAGFVQKL